MRLTTEHLGRATLSRQLLLERQDMSVADAVRRLVAIQAQEPASPYLALWNRIKAFDPAELDRAFLERVVLKASLVRITLHAVHADDYTLFHETMLPALRASRLNDARFRDPGLQVEDADGLLPALLDFTAEPRTKSEIEEMFAQRLGETPNQRLWWALRTYAPLVHAPGGSAWSFDRRQTFEAAPNTPERLRREVALEGFIRRYLSGFGPSTRHDIGRFSLIAQSTIKPVLARMDDLERLEGPNGEELFDLPDMDMPDPETPAPPKLMAMWDSILLAHADRERILDEEYRRVVIRSNGDVLPTILVDGRVAGVWRHHGGAIEVRAFHSLTPSAWAGLEEEAVSLLRLLEERDGAVYNRYQRWWAKPELSTLDARILGR